MIFMECEVLSLKPKICGITYTGVYEKNPSKIKIRTSLSRLPEMLRPLQSMIGIEPVFSPPATGMDIIGYNAFEGWIDTAHLNRGINRGTIQVRFYDNKSRTYFAYSDPFSYSMNIPVIKVPLGQPIRASTVQIRRNLMESILGEIQKQ